MHNFLISELEAAKRLDETYGNLRAGPSVTTRRRSHPFYGDADMEAIFDFDAMQKPVTAYSGTGIDAEFVKKHVFDTLERINYEVERARLQPPPPIKPMTELKLPLQDPDDDGLTAHVLVGSIRISLDTTYWQYILGDGRQRVSDPINILRLMAPEELEKLISVLDNLYTDVKSLGNQRENTIRRKVSHMQSNEALQRLLARQKR